MKRSEMIESFRKYNLFDHKFSSVINGKPYYLDYEECDAILSFFEKQGMLPPNNGTLSTSRHCDDAFLYVNEVYEWEPEDD